MISFFPQDEQFVFTASSNILNKLYLYSFLLDDFFSAKSLEPIELSISAPGTALVAYCPFMLFRSLTVSGYILISSETLTGDIAVLASVMASDFMKGDWIG